MPIITSPSFPGSMAPVTRPTFPISSWSATIRLESFHQTGGCAGRGGGRRDGRSELRAAALQELEVRAARRALGVRSRVADGVDLLPIGVVRLGQERDVDD